jgi:predicted SnoaL-like aldol condensation-catalyzing enzyme
MRDAVITNIIRSQIVEDYLYFFEDKECNSIVDLFSDECSITDWNVGTIQGKYNVARFFSELFESVEDIVADITHIHEDLNGTLTCEMVLQIDSETMLVADVFEFDSEDKIKALRAYKGS